MTDEVAARKAAIGERWMAVMADFGFTANETTATSMLVGSLTAAWQHDMGIDRDDLGARLWAALTVA